MGRTVKGGKSHHLGKESKRGGGGERVQGTGVRGSTKVQGAISV